MSRDLIVALDEGTSNVKAVAIDAGGRVLARASRPLGLITPRAAGWSRMARRCWPGLSRWCAR